jgi:hypothetical protein
MLKHKLNVVELAESAPWHRVSGSGDGLRTAKLVGVDDDGRLLARLEGFDADIAVRIGVEVGDETLRRAAKDEREVLLAFPADSAPVAVAILRERVASETSDGRVQLGAPDELVLRCGKASVVLRKDGRVTVKGTRIVSASTGPHKIKGASVELN